MKINVVYENTNGLTVFDPSVFDVQENESIDKLACLVNEELNDHKLAFRLKYNYINLRGETFKEMGIIDNSTIICEI